MKKIKSAPTCNIDIVDEAKIERVKKILPSSEEILEIADTFKVIGDPTRLKIVMALEHEEMCVCDLSALVGISVSGISHQLRLLRSNRLVKYRREGKMAYYSLDDMHVGSIINETLNHVKESII